MFIRQTRTNNTTTGESYFTHRLVRSERIGGKVRQITLLNPGRHFPAPRDDWPLLCQRIEEIISGQAAMTQDLIAGPIESAAQRYAGRLIEVTRPMRSARYVNREALPGHRCRTFMKLTSIRCNRSSHARSALSLPECTPCPSWVLSRN